MEKVLFLWKQVGFTPLQCLEMAKKANIYLPNSPTYAGRLDPLASGVLPVVDGKDLLLKKSVMKQKKEYKVSLLLGVSTDSLDLLGKVLEVKCAEVDKKLVYNCVEKLLGKHVLMVPEYSSVSAGKGSLVKNKLAGRTNEKVRREMEVFSVEFLGTDFSNSGDVLKILNSVYTTLTGDFRKEIVLGSWKEVDTNLQFSLVNFKLVVGSGTYVRSLGQFLGEMLGLPACVYSLERVRVGEVGREKCVEVNE